MKVLHVAETIRGGCGTYLNEIVPLQIARLGAEQVRCLVPAQHLAQLAQVPGERVCTFDRPSRRAGLWHLAAATDSAVRRWQPDLVHAHSTFAGAVVRLLSCVRPMPPVVYCPHGWVFDVAHGAAAGALVRAAERLLSHRARRIVAISEAERLAGERAGIRADKLVVVANGIGAACPAQRAPWHDARLKVLFVGRLDRQKGVDVLLEAVRCLGSQVSVRIVGEAVLSGAADPAAANRLSHVEFLGWQDPAAVAAQLNACDVVVMPSRWEGFGLVAVEAMRAGKPVIASAIGGLPEIVVDGVTGWLVRPDDAAALAAALAACDENVRARMGRAGRQRFLARFTSDRTSERLLQVYAEALAGQPRRGPATTAAAANTPPARPPPTGAAGRPR